MRIIGMGLAVKAEHRAVVVDARGQFLTPVLKVTTRAEDLDNVSDSETRGEYPRGSRLLAAPHPLADFVTLVAWAWTTGSPENRPE